MDDRYGFTLPEALVLLVIASLAAAAMLPQLGRMRSAALTAAGARHVAVTLQALRWKSVAQGRGHALRFVRDARGWSWYEVRDGNGNGVRTVEVLNGIDPTLAGPLRLEDFATGITLGFPPGGPFPNLPPRDGWIDDLDDPVRIGNTSLLAFSPSGTSSSGTLYLTDRRERLFAVVLYGQTAKIRVWRYAPESGRWTS